MTSLNPHQVKKMIITNYESPEPNTIFLQGSPGIGKSSVVRQASRELGINFIDLRLSLLDPTDLRGLPFLDDGKAVWAPPVFLPRKDEGILFLDEINAAPPTVQASALQLVLDRQVGEYKLPDGWMIVAAGNKETDRAVTFRMPSNLSNRFQNIMVEPDLEAWKRWAYSNNIYPGIISFLNFRPDLLTDFKPGKSKQSFATPRTWEFASRILKNPDYPEELVLPALEGCIGEGAANELIAFLKTEREIPDVLHILEGSTVAVPKDPSVLYALSGALVSGLVNLPEGLKMGPALENMMRFTMQIPEEFAVLTIKDALLHYREEIVKTSSWPLWAERFSEVIL